MAEIRLAGAPVEMVKGRLLEHDDVAARMDRRYRG